MGAARSVARADLPDLPGFEVLGDLGGGTGSVVYRVRRYGDDPAAQREYALKMVDRRPGAGAGLDPAGDALSALRREAALLTAVDHPGLPRVHDVGIVDHRPYLVMDLLRGTSLAEVLSGGQLSAERVADLILDLIEPLAAVHARGLVHRDLKPQNVMVLPDGQARLIDFGLTARERENSDLPVAVGTLAYSAPEQSGMLKRPVDARSDLYSLGVIMFEALAGQLPFPADDVGELLRAHASTSPPDLVTLAPQTPPEIALIVAALLAKDPDDRYQDGHALAADLRAFVGGARPQLPEPSLPMLGRQAELETLHRHWNRAVAGTGGFGFVRSGHGLGKTHLVHEFADRIERSGAVVLRARVLAGDPMPYAAFRDAIEGYLNPPAGSSAATRRERVLRLRAPFDGWSPAMLERLAPGLSLALRGESPPGAGGVAVSPVAAARPDQEPAAVSPTASRDDPTPEGQSGEEPLGVGIATALLHLARSGPGLLLVLDDVTAADASIREVIRHLAGQVRDAPMFYLATGRDDELEAVLGDAQLSSYVAAAARVLDVDLRLGPLDEATIAEQIRALLPGQRMPAAPLAALAKRSNGNPFVAQEYLWAGLDAGLLWPSWGTWQLDLDGLDALALPQDALGLVVNRINHLTPHARQLLRTGAAMGAQFPVDVVAAVLNSSISAVLGVLAEAVRQRLVEPADEGVFRFLHDRIAETLLADLSEGECQELHSRIAAVLFARAPHPAGQNTAGQNTAHALTTARHHMLAGPQVPVDRAVAVCTEAGLLALEEATAAVAVDVLEYAAGLLPQRRGSTSGEGPGDGTVLMLLGRALKQSGRFEAASQWLEKALEAEPDGLARARIWSLLGQVHRATYRADDLAESVRRGFEAADRPLPSNPVLLILSSMLMALASVPRSWLRPVLGDLTGIERQRAVTITELHETAQYGASLRLNVPEYLAHVLRSLLWGARLGHGSRYVMVQVHVGVLVTVAGLPRLGQYFLRRCEADPALLSPRIGAMRQSLIVGGNWAGNLPPGRVWRRQFDDFNAWLPVDHQVESIAVFTSNACLAGRTAEAQHWLAQGQARLGGHGSQIAPFVGAPAIVAALLGRSVEAETELARLNRFADQIGSRQMDFGRSMTTLFVLLEGGELGEPVDRVIDDLDVLRITPLQVWRANRPIYHLAAAARLAQLRVASAADPQGQAEQARRRAQAVRAVDQLGRAATTPEMKAFHAIAKADLHVLHQRPRQALEALGALNELELTADEDMPTVAFEAARIAARALRELNPGESARRARTAQMIATSQGWPHRAAAVAAEFDLSDLELAPAGAVSLGHSYAGGHERERLQALQEVSVAASRVLDPFVLTRIALDETIRILAADRAFLFLVEERTGALTEHLGRDSTGHDLDQLTGYSTSLVEMVRRTGEAQVVAGTDEGAALGAESVVLHGLRSILVAPMKLNDRLLGVVYLDSQVAKGIFTSDDAVILNALTGYVASALETARAAELAITVQTAQRSAALATALQRAQEQMAAQVEPLGVLNQLLRSVADVLPADLAFILRPGRSGVDNRTGVMLSVGGDRPTITAFTDDGSGGQLTGASSPRSGDGTDAPTLLRRHLPGLTSWALLPLRSADTHLGVLLVASEAVGTSLTDLLEVAAALVSQGMTAYDRAVLFEQVQELAVVDELTQLANRRRFFEVATRDLEAARRQDRPLVGIMLDIDHFKRVNDTYGHPTGDDVIQEVARRLAGQVRSTDVIGRYGGEEFSVLQQGSDEDLAERLRACVGQEPVQTRSGPLEVTVSVGTARSQPGDLDVAGLLARADRALYQAKQAGRNRVVSAD